MMADYHAYWNFIDRPRELDISLCVFTQQGAVVGRAAGHYKRFGLGGVVMAQSRLY